MAAMNTEANKVIDSLGGTSEVARLCDVRMPSVSAWRVRGIPKARMLYLKAVRPTAFKGVDLKAATAQTDVQA